MRSTKSDFLQDHCVVFLDQFFDLTQKVFGAIRLSDEAAVVRDLSSGGLHLPRGDHKQHLRPTLVDLAGEFQSVVPAWHLNIGKEQSDIVSHFHYFQRFFGIVRFDDGIPVFLKKVGRIKAQKRVVISYKDSRMAGACGLGHTA